MIHTGYICLKNDKRLQFFLLHPPLSLNDIPYVLLLPETDYRLFYRC